MKYILVLLLILAFSTATTINQLPFNADIGFPNVQVNKIPLKVDSNIVDGIYTSQFPQVNFQLSSDVFIKQGTLEDDSRYDQNAYVEADEQSGCQIFPTDFRLYSRVGFNLQDEISHVIFVDETDVNSLMNREVTGFASTVGGKIFQFKAIHSKKFKYGEDQEQKLSLVRYLDVDLPQNKKIYLLDYQRYIYFLVDEKVVCLDRQTDSISNVSGYQGHPDLIRARKMVDLGKNQKQVYVLQGKNLTVYEITDPFNWKKVQFISDINFNNSSLHGNLYQNHHFYLAGHQQIVIINNQNRDNPVLTKLQMNGTCYDIELFQTTMHVSCVYGRIRYIAEFYINSDKTSLILNRYFTDVEMPSTRWIRHVGKYIMLLVGQEQIRIINYGVNRNLLLQMKERQPNFLFQFKDGFDIKYFDAFDEQSTFSLLAIYNHRLEIMRIRTLPAELYCRFPNDKPQKVHSLLVKFNTSQCPNQDDNNSISHYGNTQYICEVSIPIQLHSHIRQLEGRTGNVISVGVIIFIVAIMAILIGCGVQAIRKKQLTIKKGASDLRKAKNKGYNAEPKPI